MTYPSIMVILAPGQDNSSILAVAADIADGFEADVIGMAACAVMPIAYGDIYVDGGLVQREREDIDADVAQSEKAFREALKGRASGLSWRSVVTFGDFAGDIVREARSADLLIVKSRPDGERDSSRNVDLHSLIMRAGRPILIAPAEVSARKLDHVLLAWKDTRETRRAAVDALPFLQNARHVSVVAIGGQRDFEELRVSVNAVVNWLKRHGVSAEPVVSGSTDDDAGDLDTMAQKQGAELIVAGAYGHSRLGEWMLGGVTRDLLVHPTRRFSLVSH